MFGVAVACPQVDTLEVDDDLWRVDVSVTTVDVTAKGRHVLPGVRLQESHRQRVK